MTINIPRMGKAKWKLGVYNMRKIEQGPLTAFPK